MRHGKFSLNLLSNLGFFCLNIFVSLWLVSYLVNKLGVAAYGLIALANSVATYFNVLTAGLNAAVGRNMAFAMSDGDKKINVIFSSSLLVSGVVALAMFFLSLPLITEISSLIDIPSGFETDAGWLFFWIVIGLAVTTLGTPYQTVIYSHNRFDLQNLGSALGLLVRVLMVLALFQIFQPMLWHVGLSVFFGSISTLFLVAFVSYRLLPRLKFSYGYFSVEVVKSISTTGGWIFVNHIGTLLLINVDLLVANIVVGATEAGRYALILLWSMLLRNLATTVSGVFGPTMIRMHAEGRSDDLVSYARLSVRFVGLGMAIPIGIVCGLSDSILMVWLGEEYSTLAMLMILATAHLAVNLAYMPLHSISVATNNVRIPGLVQIVAGVGNLLLAILLAKNYGLYGIAIAGAFVLLLRNLVFTPVYSAFIINKPAMTFVYDAVPGFLLFCFVLAMAWLGREFVHPGSWVSLGIQVCFLGFLSVCVLYVFFLKKAEKVKLGLFFNMILNRS